MFTTSNYFDKVKDIDFSRMPAAIRDGHAFVAELTNEGDNWEDYYESESIKETIDIYLSQLQSELSKEKPSHDSSSPAPVKKKARSRSSKPANVTNSALKPSETPKHKKDMPVKKAPIKKQRNSPPATKKIPKKPEAKPVERIDEELRFMKRYVSLNGKEKSKDQVLSFINSLQKSILEKRIRKTSPYAENIRYMQDNLIKLYNKMGNTVVIQIRDNILSEFSTIVGSEKVRPSIAYLKRYISMQGKTINKEKAEKLLHLITSAIDKEKIVSSDPYMAKMQQTVSSLDKYLKSQSKPEILRIHEASLNGLQKALAKCGCGQSGLDGLDVPASPEIMNSVDFAKMKFRTLGFNGKWKDLIGDPSGNFTAMIFGKPKMGKSYLSIEFAGYLARNHGRVLYVAKEEGLDQTLQQKLSDKDVKHPNLDVASELPGSLTVYDFVFLDSVNRLGLKPEDLRRLKALNPTKSFIYIFQSTKAGNFRGENSFQHDVDVVIEVPEKGKAIQMGRFNQGGQINIFENAA